MRCAAHCQTTTLRILARSTWRAGHEPTVSGLCLNEQPQCIRWCLHTSHSISLAHPTRASERWHTRSLQASTHTLVRLMSASDQNITSNQRSAKPANDQHTSRTNTNDHERTRTNTDKHGRTGARETRSTTAPQQATNNSSLTHSPPTHPPTVSQSSIHPSIHPSIQSANQSVSQSTHSPTHCQLTLTRSLPRPLLHSSHASTPTHSLIWSCTVEE